MKENKEFNTIIINNINYNTIIKTKTNEINNQVSSNKVKEVKKEIPQKEVLNINKESKENKKVLNINLNTVNNVVNNANPVLNDKKMPVSTKVEGNKPKIFSNLQIDFKSPKNNTLISSNLKDSSKNITHGVSGIKKK